MNIKERHNIDVGALDCWCDPVYRTVCPECDGVVRFANCWRCKVGTIAISREDAERMNGNVIVVHNEEDK